jgi:MFS family permease
MSTHAVTSRAAMRALVVLTAINLFNYMDRYVVPPILSDLKRAMALSDTQLGWLAGAFMIVYMILALVFGALGDRGSRTRPIAIGVFVWSLATMLSGFARNYPQLLAGRALVGVGEAAYVAIAPALLADLFSTEARGRVYSVLNMAIPVGSALGFIVGGQVSEHFGWRAAFFVAGIPGLLLAAAVLWLPDPPRGSRDPAGATAGGKQRRAPLAVYLGLMRRPPYALLVLGYAAYTFALGGLAFWMPEFLMRVHGIAKGPATTGFGIIVVVTGFVGTFVGGWLGDYCLRYSRQAYLWFSGAATLLAVPFAVLALTAATGSVYFPGIILAQLLLFMSTGPINAAIINIVSPLERASAMALSMFAIHLLGDVPSPVLIGRLSDLSSLGRAVLVVPVAIAIGGLIWLAAARAEKHAAGAAAIAT